MTAPPVVQDLGRITGDVVFFGGPYSNLQALEALVAKAGGRTVIGTGDIVAYCADAAACVARIRALEWPIAAGNCERQIASGEQDCGCGFEDGTACDLLARGWYAHALRSCGPDHRAWMASLPDILLLRAHGRRIAVIHGGATAINRFLWPVSDDRDFAGEIAALNALAGPVDMVVAGHAGIPFLRQIDGVTWLNAGTIGLPPHDGASETRYAVLSSDGPVIESLRYDSDAAAQAMARAGLGPDYAMALNTGWWPSEDILPMALRRGAAA